MGLILVFTGNGKGKTTAALGLVLRAAGHGLKSIVAHLMKTGIYRGEVIGEALAIRKVLSEYVEEYFLDPRGPRTPRALLQHALARAREVKPFLLVLDEVNNAVNKGFLTVEEVIQGISTLPKETHVVLTGRGAPREFIDMANLVTVMEPLKHYYREGHVGIRGLEW